MASDPQIAVEQRILQVLDHLNIERAHFGAQSLGELTTIATHHPERLASLTLICPGMAQREHIESLASRLLVYVGDTLDWQEASEFYARLPGATVESLRDWEPWSDVVARHLETVLGSMPGFLARHSSAVSRTVAAPDGARGDVAGITYHVQGSGPPLVLLPLGLVPSQWDPVLPALAEEYTTILLGGPELGMTALLEKRASTDGYLGMFRYLVEEMSIAPGESILEVGCGTGALTRWLVRYTGGANPVTGVDINRYLLWEASNLARMDGLEARLDFESGNAEELPYPDDAFDVTLSSTVMEEVDADRMLAEMIRVTRPGGRVGVIVRAMDLPFFINMRLDQTLKSLIEDPTTWVNKGSRGCADVGLYRRFQSSTLTAVKMFPHLVAFTKPWILDLIEGAVLPRLNPEESVAWQAARTAVEAEGTFIFGYAHHCAIGTVPS